MTIFFRLLEADDKETALHQAIQQVAQQQSNSITFTVESESFQRLPGAPFAYWVAEKLRDHFNDLPRFENTKQTVKVGLQTSDDFRFLRVWWEIEASKIVVGLDTYKQKDFVDLTIQGKKWSYFAKGGEYSTYYSELSLVINWEFDGKEIKAWAGSLYSNSHWSRIIKNVDYYFRPGLTYPPTALGYERKGLGLTVLPIGCLFGHKACSVFIKEIHQPRQSYQAELYGFLGLLNSLYVDCLIRTIAQSRSWEAGHLQKLPIPNFDLASKEKVARLARRAWSLKRSLDTITHTSHAFVLPVLLQVKASNLCESARIWTNKVAVVQTELVQIQTQIDDLIFDLYGISESDHAGIENEPQISDSKEGSIDEDEDDSEVIAADLPTLARELLDYLCSVAFGRFDVMLAIGDQEFPAEPEPFDPLPVCSPGMLVGKNGLPPTAPDEVHAGYPIKIPFDGILVDDEGHPKDIIRHVRHVFKLIWGEKDSDIEQETCEILKVSNLRDYFRKPAAFFNDHLIRYSKSRRQAPIYLPLSTASGSYTLWLYYHRLTDQTLYTCINDYVEPKLNRISETIKFLRGKASRTRDEENDLEDLQTLEDELTKFGDELLRVAQLPWKPNLNDGVQITVAPFHSLFRLSKWQKKLKETWDKLEKGDYDWAHLAHSIWTTRVREKCRTDKSLAIAHGLEELYEPPPETPKRTKRKKKE